MACSGSAAQEIPLYWEFVPDRSLRNPGVGSGRSAIARARQKHDLPGTEYATGIHGRVCRRLFPAAYGRHAVSIVQVAVCGLPNSRLVLFATWSVHNGSSAIPGIGRGPRPGRAPDRALCRDHHKCHFLRSICSISKQSRVFLRAGRQRILSQRFRSCEPRLRTEDKLKSIVSPGELFATLLLALCLTACSGVPSSTPRTSPSSATAPDSPPATSPQLPSSSSSPTPSPSPTGSQSTPGLPAVPASAIALNALDERTECNPAARRTVPGEAAMPATGKRCTKAAHHGMAIVFNSTMRGSADALWWLKLGPMSATTNLLWDFYVQVDSTSLQAAQAIEFDTFQFVEGYVYMMGTQCDDASGCWEVWDEYNGQWRAPACPARSSRLGIGTTYRSMSNGWPPLGSIVLSRLRLTRTRMLSTKSMRPNTLAGGDNPGVQYQLDVNATGVGYPVWVDQSTLTAW